MSLSFGRFAVGLLLLSAVVSLSQAAVPAPDAFFPAGGQVGSSQGVKAGGKLDGWPVGAWTDHPGLTFTATTNAGLYVVKVAADVPPGPHLVRLFNAEGSAEPRTFVVGRREELNEVEPNDDYRKAQTILPVGSVINGRLDKPGDVDSFAIQVEAGQWVVAAVDAYALGSSVDPVVQILDDRGVRVAFSHDTHNLDPLTAWRAERSGTCYVQVLGFIHPPGTAVAMQGSAAHVYRLTVTSGPFARFAQPLGVKRGTGATLKLLGWNLPPGAASNQPVDATRTMAAETNLVVPAALTGDSLWLGVGDAPELVEAEPNNTSQKAQPVSFPATLNGSIGTPGDVDRFGFTAKKGDRFSFRVRAVGLHSPLAARIRVEDTNGVALVSAEGGDNTDPRLAWNATTDGQFVLAVSDMFGNGGWDHVYRIETAPPPPHFTASIPTHAFFVENGKTNEIKVTVTRVEGFKEKLSLSVKGLPAGVTAKAGEITDKGGEVKVQLTAAADAPPANVPLEFLISAPEVRPPMSVAARFSLLGVEPRGERLISSGHVAWLTVANKPAPPPPPKKKK